MVPISKEVPQGVRLSRSGERRSLSPRPHRVRWRRRAPGQEGSGRGGLVTCETYDTVIAEDEENFLDRSKTRFLYTVEQPIFG